MFPKYRNTFITLLSAFALLTGSPAEGLDFSNVSDYLYPEASKTISMDFKDASLNDVLKIFSQQSGQNFIAASGVADSTINLYLDQVPVQEALERILSANSLTYEIKPGSNIFVVKAIETAASTLMTRVYRLKNATVSSSKLLRTLDSEDEDSASAEGEEGTGIKGAIEALLTDEGSVVEDSRTNSLIVTDIPAQFPVIEQTIARLDIRVPQILIEVEMLDVSKSTTDLLGAKFGSKPFEFVKGPTKDTYWPFNQTNLAQQVGGPSGIGNTTIDTTAGIGALSFEGLTFALNFLRSQTDTKNLARPRLLTLNNETAEIEIKTDEAIGILSVTTGDATQSTNAEPERVDTGVFLKVTPQANLKTGKILMAIEPRVTEVRTGKTFTLNKDDTTFNDPEERSTRSILLVDDGDTIMIGGLLRTDEDIVKTRVPGLGSLPIIGAAFRHQDKKITQRELVIFITPHIIKDDIAKINSKMSSFKQISREQPLSSKRLKAVDKDLAFFEKKSL